MPKIAYKRRKFGAPALATIAQANEILDDYAGQGFDLTLRQLYYQFVARGLIPNSDREYKKLQGVISEGRMAGLIDWTQIVDRTRNLKSQAHWRNPASLVESASRWFHLNLWDDQPVYVEVWIEKDALVGVIEGVCNRFDVPFFSCRGYTSSSEVWSAAQRLGYQLAKGKQVKVFHLGDHDPSGIDMTRDIEERLFTFLANDYYRGMRDDGEPAEGDSDEAVEYVDKNFSVERLALHMSQIEQYEPPPNPAKMTDSRYAGYIRDYGTSSWELDALEPTVISDLIEAGIETVYDADRFDATVEREQGEIAKLRKVAAKWAEVEKVIA